MLGGEEFDEFGTGFIGFEQFGGSEAAAQDGDVAVDTGGDDGFAHGRGDDELRARVEGGLTIFGGEDGAHANTGGVTDGFADGFDGLNGTFAGEGKFEDGDASGDEGTGDFNGFVVVGEADNGDEFVIEDVLLGGHGDGPSDA